MARQPRVALLVETSNAYARGLLHGVKAYLREHRPWSLFLDEQGRGDEPPRWLSTWRGDGMIARVENPAIAEVVARVNVPTVDLSAARLLPQLPWFETDDAAIGKMAAEHLLERGFKTFAFCGDARYNWSRWREKHFVDTVRTAGRDCIIFDQDTGTYSSAEENLEAIDRWLLSLPRPVGIMTNYDIRGRQVLDACRRLDIAVPEDMAVISVDNDDLLCELSHPPLTSVVLNPRRTGYEAAALLDRMMRGEDVGNAPHFVPPLGIATRQSTDVLAVDDRNVARAVRFIREHAFEDIRVTDVAKAASLSRRSLEGRFQKLLGRTPHAEILRMQLERVKQLLAETNLTLAEIAERAGFKHVEYLSVAFKREIGIPPSVFRANNRR